MEDVALQHLAKFNGQLVCTFVDASTFSFYPGKNLGAMVDAVAIVTNDLDLANKMSMFARHGGLKKGDHKIEGINSRMDCIQAAILSVKMLKIKEWTSLRQVKANRYSKYLKGIDGLSIPVVASESECVWHVYVIKAEGRDELAACFDPRGVQTDIN